MPKSGKVISAAERCGLIEAGMEDTFSFRALTISAAERCGLIEAKWIDIEEDLEGRDFRSRTLRPH